MNTLTLKTLLLSVMTEIKFGHPLAQNALPVKQEFKKLVGLKKGATNLEVLKEMKRVYTENNLLTDFTRVVESFKLSHLIPA